MMSRISAFYGIVIWMYHDERHGSAALPRRLRGDEASIDIGDLAVIAGQLPVGCVNSIALHLIAIVEAEDEGKVASFFQPFDQVGTVSITKVKTCRDVAEDLSD